MVCVYEVVATIRQGAVSIEIFLITTASFFSFGDLLFKKSPPRPFVVRRSWLTRPRACMVVVVAVAAVAAVAVVAAVLLLLLRLLLLLL